MGVHRPPQTITFDTVDPIGQNLEDFNSGSFVLNANRLQISAQPSFEKPVIQISTPRKMIRKQNQDELLNLDWFSSQTKNQLSINGDLDCFFDRS